MEGSGSVQIIYGFGCGSRRPKNIRSTAGINESGSEALPTIRGLSKEYRDVLNSLVAIGVRHSKEKSKRCFSESVWADTL
jgi:hypothetical protein